MANKTNPQAANDFPEEQIEKFEERLRQFSAGFSYPTTPDIATKERERLSGKRHQILTKSRLAVGLAVLLIVLVTGLWVSPARARVLEWFRIGSVKIFFTMPTSIPTESVPGRTVTPAFTPTPLDSILDLAGETTFQKAVDQVDFPISLPEFPSDLGKPDHVFVQQFGGPVLTLVWLEPDQPEAVRMSLSVSRSEKAIFEKYEPNSLLETQVNDDPAVWVDSDYLLIMRNGDATFTRLIDQGRTLIWTNGELTFRLEVDTELETALQIAESIR